jgi:hypothetical protein
MEGNSMASYRKKPVVIEAFQVTKELVIAWARCQEVKPKEIKELDVWWIGDVIAEQSSSFGGIVDTLEGKMEFKVGDWLIRGVANELYPCKDAIFKATYEPV